jgi:VPDSG-CTERM motif
MKNKALIGSLALLAFVVFSGPAKAVLLPPGSPPLPPDDFTSTNLAGATELASTTSMFSTTLGTTTGTITASVFSDPTNFFGSGHLTFVYQIHNDAGSLDALFRGTATNFSGFMTDVGFTSLGLAIPGGHFVNGTMPPVTVDRLNSSGDTVGFNFVALMPGDTSYALIIETNATEFAPGNFSVIDGGVATVPAYQPSVPDGGSTVALLGITLAGLEGVRRMFRARKS